MPSTSKKQHNLMAAVANNPAFAKKVGIKQSVGAEFMKADKGRKFKEGGAADMKQDKAMVKKAVGMHDKQLHGGKKTDLTKLKKGGYCGGGKMKKYAEGGSIIQDLKDKVMGTEEQNKAAAERMKKEDAKSPDTVQAKVNRMVDKVVSKKAGGSIRGCGCAVKGKTKGRMV